MKGKIDLRLLIEGVYNESVQSYTENNGISGIEVR